LVCCWFCCGFVVVVCVVFFSGGWPHPHWGFAPRFPPPHPQKQQTTEKAPSFFFFWAPALGHGRGKNILRFGGVSGYGLKKMGGVLMDYVLWIGGLDIWVVI
jgi:hypothetical protein